MYMAQMCERNFESVNCQRNQLNPTEIVIHLAFGYQRKKKTKISEKKKQTKIKIHAHSNMVCLALLDFMLITILKLKNEKKEKNNNEIVVIFKSYQVSAKWAFQVVFWKIFEFRIVFFISGR